MSDVLARLRTDLTAALRARDREALATLRTVVAAVENAQAQPLPGSEATTATNSAWVAGGAVGVGAAEVERKELDDDAVRAIVRDERDTRRAAADEIEKLGGAVPADELRKTAALLDSYL